MSFTDFVFFPYLFIVAIVYYIVPLKYRWYILLGASILFYATWGIELIPFVLGTTLIAWIAGLCMTKECHKNESKKQGTKNKKRIILLIAVIIVCVVLLYVKIQKNIIEWESTRSIGIFLSEMFRSWASFCYKIPGLNYLVKLKPEITGSAENVLIVPIGISYYSMSLIGYLVDVYYRKEDAETNYFKLLLFAIFFPKILEGPISKRKKLGKTLYRGKEFDYNRLCFGLQRMLWGYIKKLVVADRLNIMVTDVFENYYMYGGSELLVAAIFSAFALYCDFSGCMDIVIGVAELFGVEIEENFKRPFFSKTVAEFWRRWHITLGAWFKDYVYMPIAINPYLIKTAGKLGEKFGKKCYKIIILSVPILVVWLLTGIWHGTGMNYVVWGIYWGIIIIISNVFENELRMIVTKFNIDTESMWYEKFQIVRTFVFFVLSRTIVVPRSLYDSVNIIKKILFINEPWHLVNGDLFLTGLNRANFMVCIIFLLAIYYVEKSQEKGVSIRKRIAVYPIGIRWTIYIAAIVAVFIFGIYGPGYDESAFVYMNY